MARYPEDRGGRFLIPLSQPHTFTTSRHRQFTTLACSCGWGVSKVMSESQLMLKKLAHEISAHPDTTPPI